MLLGCFLTKIVPQIIGVKEHFSHSRKAGYIRLIGGLVACFVVVALVLYAAIILSSIFCREKGQKSEYREHKEPGKNGKARTLDSANALPGKNLHFGRLGRQ
jgi:hypothetical protein